MITTQPGHPPPSRARPWSVRPWIPGRRLAASALAIFFSAVLAAGAGPSPAARAQALSPTPPAPVATGPAPNSPLLDTDVTVALISFLAGSVAALLGILSKYLLDYRLERRKLELQERQDIAAVIGSSQANLIRATRDLFRWLSSFFDHPDRSREWLTTGPKPAEDAYSLREWVRLLFQFMAWGRITQDAINALPAVVVKERPDLQQAFVFVDLVLDLLSYGGLFKELETYNAEGRTMRLLAEHVDVLAEAGLRLRQADNGAITRAAVDDLYRSPGSALLPVREFVLRLNGDEALAAGFIVARLAAVRAAAAGFLLGYSWTLDLPREGNLAAELRAHLAYASRTSGAGLPFREHVPRNLNELIVRYRCGFLRLPRE